MQPGSLSNSLQHKLHGYLQGAQLEPLLGSAKFLAVVLELLVSSHVIMVSTLMQHCYPRLLCDVTVPHPDSLVLHSCSAMCVFV